MANISSIGGNPIVPAAVQPDTVTDAMLAQTGGVLDSISQITNKMQVVGNNWCSGVSNGYMNLNGTVYASTDYVYTDKIPVSEGDIVKTYSLLDGVFSSRSQRFVTAFDASDNAVSVSGAEFSNNYTVPSGVASVVISVGVATDYMVTKNYLATEYEPYGFYYIATSDFLGDLLAEKVDKNGTAQVKTTNIDGFSATSLLVDSVNIFSEEWFYSLGYVYIDNHGKIYIGQNDDYRTYIMPVNGNIYKFTNVRFAAKLASDKSTVIGDIIQYVTEIDSDGASWIAFSFNPTSYPTYEVKERLPVYEIPINWKLGSAEQKRAYGRVTGELADGGTLSIDGRSAIKDGQTIVFKGHLTSFASISLNFTNTSTVTNYVQVDATNVTIKNANTAMASVAHGLTIQNDICIKVEFVNGQAEVTITSSGESFTTTVSWYQTGGTVTQPQVASTGTVCDVATLESVYPASKRKVWYFGDSYISFGTQERWPYYLVADGLSGSVLFSGSAGANSNAAAIALTTLLNYGTPDVAVFATGMNDGSDGDTPPSLWSTSRDTFLTLCEQNGITPVFCTVPTVPIVNNEQKNAWVKASDYRYIDLAAAVGADGSGAWYTGMLSSDNVHPTAKGAKALYSQVLIDLPEIFGD